MRGLTHIAVRRALIAKLAQTHNACHRHTIVGVYAAAARNGLPDIALGLVDLVIKTLDNVFPNTDRVAAKGHAIRNGLDVLVGNGRKHFERKGRTKGERKEWMLNSVWGARGQVFPNSCFNFSLFSLRCKKLKSQLDF